MKLGSFRLLFPTYDRCVEVSCETSVVASATMENGISSELRETVVVTVESGIIGDDSMDVSSNRALGNKERKYGEEIRPMKRGKVSFAESCGHTNVTLSSYEYNPASISRFWTLSGSSILTTAHPSLE